VDNARRACERPWVRRAAPLAFVVRAALLAAWASSALAFRPALARAAEPEITDPAELFRAAEEDDRRHEYARALRELERAMDLAPSAAFIPKARARAQTLREHSEGGFVPFTELEAMRANRAAADDPAALEAFAAKAATFPPGPVRGEARMLVAEAYVGRLHRPADAAPLLEKVASDASADPLTARLALDMLVDVHLTLGDLDAAGAAVQRHAALAEPSLVKRVTTLVRRRALHRAALGLVVGAGTLILSALGSAAARGELPVAGRALRASYRLFAGFLAYVALAGALLATQYEAGTSAPFFAFGVAALPLALGARAWAAVGSPSPAARAGRAVVCAMAVFAAAFLVLERIDAEYLKGFGL
jgi:hypothetical protein